MSLMFQSDPGDIWPGGVPAFCLMSSAELRSAPILTSSSTTARALRTAGSRKQGQAATRKKKTAAALVEDHRRSRCEIAYRPTG